MKKTLQPNFNDRICKLEFQLAQDREHIDALMTELKHVQSQYDLAMKRIDYLETQLIRTNKLVAANFLCNID